MGLSHRLALELSLRLRRLRHVLRWRRSQVLLILVLVLVNSRLTHILLLLSVFPSSALTHSLLLDLLVQLHNLRVARHRLPLLHHHSLSLHRQMRRQSI